MNARLVVLSINDTRATELAIRKIRATAPETALVVRAQYEMDKSSLQIAGATEVVTAESTASAAIVSSSLEALTAPKTEA